MQLREENNSRKLTLEARACSEKEAVLKRCCLLFAGTGKVTLRARPPSQACGLGVDREPHGISAPGKQLSGKFSTSLSTCKGLEPWSTAAGLHPQLEAELVRAVSMALILES